MEEGLEEEQKRKMEVRDKDYDRTMNVNFCDSLASEQHGLLMTKKSVFFWLI